jgi:CMP-N-acetylneuraminic acid synthetase
MGKDIKDILFILTARVNSTRTPLKMIRPFANTTLFEISIQKMLDSKIIPKDQLYLSLYDQELIDIAKKYNCNIFYRSKESANAEKSLQQCYEWWDKLPFKYVVYLNSCHPLITTNTIDNFIQTYINNDYNGLFGVIKKKQYFWNKNHELVTPWPEGYKILNTKAVEETYEAAHTLYAGRMDLIGQDIFMGSFQGVNDPVLFEMDELECFDIDFPWQFDIAEVLYEKSLTLQC